MQKYRVCWFIICLSVLDFSNTHSENTIKYFVCKDIGCIMIVRDFMYFCTNFIWLITWVEKTSIWTYLILAIAAWFLLKQTTKHCCKKNSIYISTHSSFLEKLKQFALKPTDTLFSFDVVSLFMNVPLKETIQIIIDKIYRYKEKTNFEKSTFIQLMEIATSGIFMPQGRYCQQTDEVTIDSPLPQGRYCQQTDEVTIDSPLGPTIANFCLAHLEEQLLMNCTENDDPVI